jgi:hypothetical protein
VHRRRAVPIGDARPSAHRRGRREGRTRQSLREPDRIDITVEDVIAHNGPRVPSFEDAPKDFSTAFVAVVLPGRDPSPELLERTGVALTDTDAAMLAR